MFSINLLRKLVKEYDRIKQDCYKLSEFILFDKQFKDLSKFYQELLRTQFSVMESYKNILRARIEYLKELI